MCPCARTGKFRFRVASCNRPFLNRLDDLVKLVSGLKKLDKQDADNRVPFSVLIGHVWVVCTLSAGTVRLYRALLDFFILATKIHQDIFFTSGLKDNEPGCQNSKTNG